MKLTNKLLLTFLKEKAAEYPFLNDIISTKGIESFSVDDMLELLLPSRIIQRNIFDNIIDFFSVSNKRSTLGYILFYRDFIERFKDIEEKEMLLVFTDEMTNTLINSDKNLVKNTETLDLLKKNHDLIQKTIISMSKSAINKIYLSETLKITCTILTCSFFLLLLKKKL